MFKLFLISVVIIFIISYYRKKTNKIEVSQILKEFYKNINMEDFQRNNGGFTLLYSFSLIIVLFTLFMVRKGVDAKIGLIFCGWMFLIIVLALISTLTTRRNIIKLIKKGTVIQGTIIKKEKIQSHEDLFPSYYYCCIFEIDDENGDKKEINASLTEKLKDCHNEGEFIKLVYLKENNIRCMELPSEKEIEMFFSKKIHIINIIIGFVLLGISLIGLNFLSFFTSNNIEINYDLLLKVVILSVNIITISITLYFLFFEKKEFLNHK